jgi:hypothetical protein
MGEAALQREAACWLFCLPFIFILIPGPLFLPYFF